MHCAHVTVFLRCLRCHGSVETPPCLNRSKGNVPSVWRFAPDNIHTYRDLLRGLLLQTGTRTGARSGVSVSKTMHQSFQAGGKAVGPKRSVLPLTLRRKLCSGTQPSDTTPNYPLPHFSMLCWFFPATSGVSGQPIRAPGGCYPLMSRTMVVTIAIFLLVQVVMFSYHHWWYLIFFYFLWLDSCNIMSRIDIWWIDIF